MSASPPDVTQLLQRLAAGDQEALSELLPLVYAHLRNLARNIRRERGATPTLNTTALVHEAYLKMVRQPHYESRLHFQRVAAQAMRQVLYTYAEQQHTAKRGGNHEDMSLEGLDISLPVSRWEELYSLEQGMLELETRQPRQARVIECRFFGGLTLEETAQALDLSPATVKRDWNLARAWLYAFLK